MQKRHGPLPKPEADRRNCRVSVFLTSQEKSALAERSGKITISQYLRLTGFGLRPPTQTPQIHLHLWRDLARVGGNLNQIAHNLNSGMDVEISNLLAVIKQVDSRLKEVREKLK
jgi:hypothetical protein